MSDRVATLLADVEAVAALQGDAREACFRRTSWLGEATGDEVERFFRQLLEQPPPAHDSRERLIAAAVRQLVIGQRGAAGAAAGGAAVSGVTDQALSMAARLYREWGSRTIPSPWLLCLLTSARTPGALADFADLTASDPPEDAGMIASIFAPLFQRADYDPHLLFPRLLDGITHASTAPLVLDLANYLTRQRRLDPHPAAGRQTELVRLLGALVGRLGALETAMPGDASEWKSISRQVEEGVAVAVSLCDALALIGDTSAVARLYQAAELTHRRLRVEAAAALARLGEEWGADVLTQMAGEPVARLRALAYAEELGVLDRVDDQYQSASARAEAELALFLAQPSQIGVPPNRSELLDSRTLYWPGYERPVTCHLFRFTYAIGDAEFSSIGIAGPLTHAFAADLSDLSPDDIYAAFAGWQAEGAEIVETDVADANDSQQVEVSRLRQKAADADFATIQPLTLGSFFGTSVLVAAGERNGTPGVLVVDDQRIYWWPRAAGRRPIGPLEAYCIYKGQKLLRAFNP